PSGPSPKVVDDFRWLCRFLVGFWGRASLAVLGGPHHEWMASKDTRRRLGDGGTSWNHASEDRGCSPSGGALLLHDTGSGKRARGGQKGHCLRPQTLRAAEAPARSPRS